MAQITNGTPVASPITPGLDDQNTFPTHSAKYGEGGFEIRPTLADIKTITPERRSKKLCLNEDDGKFYHYSTTANDWVELVINGGSGGGLTEAQVKALFGVTIEQGKLTFDREIYAPKFSTAPSTITVGNLDISGGNGTLSVYNLSDGSRALAIGMLYSPDGSTVLRSYDLSPLSWHDRQMDSSEVQPTADYDFKFRIPDNLIRVALAVIPAETGTLSLESYDLLGNAVTETEQKVITPNMVGQEVIVNMKNQAPFVKDADMLFRNKGVRLKGKRLANPYDGALTFYPYFRAYEYIINGRPEILTQSNVASLHSEDCIDIPLHAATTIPVDKFNTILSFEEPFTTPTIAQTLPDITKVRDGAKIYVYNRSSSANKTVVLSAFNSTQRIDSGASITVKAKTMVAMMACKSDATWYVISDTSKLPVTDLSNIIDGGDAYSVHTRIFDGGGA